MSADDGWLLRKDKDHKFVIQHMFMSAEEPPDINSEHAKRFETIEEALDFYETMDLYTDYPSEYGLIVRIKEVTE